MKPATGESDESVDAVSLRSAIRDGLKLRLHYRSEAGRETDRTVWPVILGYAETSRLLVAWCELRQSFRHFRADRIVEFEVLTRPTACVAANCDAVGNDGARRTSTILRETDLAAIGPPW